MAKKILYLIPRFIAAGAEQMVLQYAKYFKENGYEVAVASVIGGGELVEKFRALGVEIYVSRGRTLGGWRGLKKFYRRFQPDLVHSHVFSADLAAYLLINKKTKWICTQHNVEFAASALRRFIWKKILRRADKIIAVSENVSEYVSQEFKVDSGKLIVVRNSVELKKWLAVDEKIPGQVLRIATVGRLEKQKGHIYLIQALAQLKDKNWQWHIYGAGSLERKLKYLVEKQGISDKVFWHGVSANMAEEFKSIDLLIQPSLWEGLSIVAMEAMASSKVVMGTPYVADVLIKNKINGLIVKTGDVNSLVEALKYCFENLAQLSVMGKKARETAVKMCDMKLNCEKVGEMYESVLENSR